MRFKQASISQVAITTYQQQHNLRQIIRANTCYDCFDLQIASRAVEAHHEARGKSQFGGRGFGAQQGKPCKTCRNPASIQKANSAQRARKHARGGYIAHLLVGILVLENKQTFPVARHNIQVSVGHLAVWRHLGMGSATLLHTRICRLHPHHPARGWAHVKVMVPACLQAWGNSCMYDRYPVAHNATSEETSAYREESRKEGSQSSHKRSGAYPPKTTQLSLHARYHSAFSLLGWPVYE